MIIIETKLTILTNRTEKSNQLRMLRNQNKALNLVAEEEEAEVGLYERQKRRSGPHHT